MRSEIMQWIDKEFGNNKGFVNYTENVNEKLIKVKDEPKIFLITEIMFVVGTGNVRKSYIKPETHKRWKEEIEVLADLGCDGCRVKMEADWSKRSVTPDGVDIVRGALDVLLVKSSFTLTFNIFKKIPVTEK